MHPSSADSLIRAGQHPRARTRSLSPTAVGQPGQAPADGGPSSDRRCARPWDSACLAEASVASSAVFTAAPAYLAPAPCRGSVANTGALSQTERLTYGSKMLNADGLRALGPERCDSLDQMLAARRRALAGEDTRDAAPLVGDGLLAPLFGTAQERAAERQLLSFAAASSVPLVAAHALLTQSTSDRLSAALCALRVAGSRKRAQ